jgi:hypothetical protein
MTREAWERTITDSAGNVLTGVQVSVFQSDGSTVATIYGQQSGGAPIANPFNTGVQTSAKFYADPGRYVVRVLKDGLTKEFTDVSIADKAIRDDLGTAAYLTATTSQNDATPGRALRVGDFGLGAPLPPSVTSWPSAVGSYLVLAVESLPFAPVGASGPYVIRVDRENMFTLTQNATQMTREIYQGVFPSGAPSNPALWVKSYTSGNILGTVAFSGGVNTGAIIERGANANGEYTRYADGTMECWAFAAPGSSALSTSIGNLWRTGLLNWTFPASFVSPPVVTGADKPTMGYVVPSGDTTSTYVEYVVIGPVQGPVSSNTRIRAIGRWRN